MVFNCSLYLSSTLEITFSSLVISDPPNHISMFFLYLITSSSLTGEAPHSYSITIHTLWFSDVFRGYRNRTLVCKRVNLPFAPKNKPLLVKKGNKFLNLPHLLLSLTKTLSSAPSPAPIVSSK